MMRSRTLLAGLFLFLLFPRYMAAQQDSFAGSYAGLLQGDPITLELSLTTMPKRLEGQLRDSRQAFTVSAETDGQVIKGTATESTYGITLAFTGSLSGNTLTLKMRMEGIEMEAFEVVMNREGVSIESSSVSTMAADDRERDPGVVGTWVNEQVYNSGFGDNFMGSSTVNRITFGADGRLFEGAGAVTMGGSNYTGQSTGTGAGEVPGIRWYSQNREIWLLLTQNGQPRQVKMGRYAVDGSNMLLTADNGQKLLFRRE